MALHITRRRATTNILAASVGVLAMEAISCQQTASGFDFGMTAPEQTLEEAESGIKGHAQSLIQVKELLEAESWNAAQKALRKSSAYLKQDIYTIIQAKPGSERPELRKLYSDLFNSVTRLDYAARDENVPRIWDCYGNVVSALSNILSRL
ncbi:psbQ-like protein 3, chloroplastic [Coffea arabica]|uniref:PsbQ-like protein 3, chloroplastic n=1 Tax=Coffea arabica TaxID=13443 RepID=A0A6P6T7S1_COFAR